MTAVPPLDLVPVWTVLLAFTVVYYVLFDGFDLGVGMLYGLAPHAAWRPVIMRSILPVCGTATKPGSSWAGSGCSRLFRLASLSSFRRSIFRSSSCFGVGVPRGGL